MHLRYLNATILMLVYQGMKHNVLLVTEAIYVNHVSSIMGKTISENKKVYVRSAYHIHRILGG